jgi:hypothetical protein
VHYANDFFFSSARRARQNARIFAKLYALRVQFCFGFVPFEPPFRATRTECRATVRGGKAGQIQLYTTYFTEIK